MSLQDKSIDFCEQKAIYENLGKVRKISRMTMEDMGNNVIGLTMIMDKSSGISCAWKAQYAVDSTKENPVIIVVSNFGNEHKKYNVVLQEINPSHATLLEMFALCSYADNNHLCDGIAFGSFKELKNYLTMEENQTICKQKMTYEQLVVERSNWEENVLWMKRQYLTAGLYAQYQACLYLLDIIDFAKEKGEKDKVEIIECTSEETIAEEVKNDEEIQDKTADTVMTMIKDEWYKYCID